MSLNMTAECATVTLSLRVVAAALGCEQSVNGLQGCAAMHGIV